MSAIDCLSFLLAQDIQNSTLGRNGVSLRTVLDSSKETDEVRSSLVASINIFDLKIWKYNNKKYIESTHWVNVIHFFFRVNLVRLNV